MPGSSVLRVHPLCTINVNATLMRDDGQSAPLYRGRLCGTLEQRVVVLEGTEPLPFQVGERLVVHTNLLGRAIGFVTSVIGRADQPAPHFYLSFPDEYEDLELRKAARVPALIPVRIELGSELRLDEGARPMEGVLINVSRSGCALSALQAFGPNDGLTLTMTLPGRPGEYRLDVTVVSRKDSLPLHVHGARFRRGLQPPASLRALQDWIAHQESFWPNPTWISRRQN